MSHRLPAMPSVNQTSGLLCSFRLGPGLEPGTGSGEMGSSVELQTERRTNDWLSLRASCPFRLTLNPTLESQLDWRFNAKRVEFKLRGTYQQLFEMARKTVNSKVFLGHRACASYCPQILSEVCSRSHHCHQIC